MLDRYTFLPLVAAIGFPIRVNYRHYITSATWRRKAAACKKRAGYRCQVCNGPRQLEAHHRNYERLGHERPDDITCLCNTCHGLFSTKGKS